LLELDDKNLEEFVVYHGKKIYIENRVLNLPVSITSLTEIEGLEKFPNLKKLVCAVSNIITTAYSIYYFHWFI
jgi:hypothetical protein